MQETWTQYEAASAALAPPRQWHFIDEAQTRNLKSSTCTPNSPSTSESSGFSCYDSGYEKDERYEGCLGTFHCLALQSPGCPEPKLDPSEAETMSDPFAVRMNFKRSYLEKLTSSPVTQIRAASYALKYREQDEDLHSCILEQLDAVRIPSEDRTRTKRLMD